MTAAKSATALVGDIGGTNARFALADVSGKRPSISQIREYPSKNYKCGGDAIAPERRSPEYLAKFLASQVKKWEAPIKASGIQLE